MKKIIIEVFICLLMICFFIVLVTLFYLINSNNSKNINNGSDNNQIANNIISSNTNNNSTTNNTNTNNNNEIDYNNSEYIFYNEAETGDAKYSREQLENFEFNINNIPDTVQSYIENKEEFNLSIKEYIYKNGLVDATIAEFEKYQIQQETNRLGIVLKLNNETEHRLLVIINLNDNSIEIMDY